MTEQLIWNLLINEIKNPYGVAGLMGNLFAESGLNSLAVNKKGIRAEEYVRQIQDGTIRPETFAHDGIAFGLAQWRYWSRKESLLKNTGADKIGDTEAQVKFLLSEIKTYKTVWNVLVSATSVKEASDVVLTKYEKPANTGDAIKNKRAGYGEKFYQKFTGAGHSGQDYVYTTVDRVNIRTGNDKHYPVITLCKKAGTQYPYVATSANGWYAVELAERVGWICGDFAKRTE